MSSIPPHHRSTRAYAIVGTVVLGALPWIALMAGTPIDPAIAAGASSAALALMALVLNAKPPTAAIPLVGGAGGWAIVEAVRALTGIVLLATAIGCGGSRPTTAEVVTTACKVRNVTCQWCDRVCNATRACENVGGE